MIRNATILSLLLLLCTVKFAAADSYDDCMADCMTTFNQCVDGITLYDPVGIQEAKAACKTEMGICGKKCHDVEDMGPEGYQEKLRKEAEEAEKKRQEQDMENNGGIKVYNPDH